jgi:hypothetical protein
MTKTASDALVELVYDADAAPFIRQTWPQAQIKDASDQIHEGRFEVTIPGLSPAEFYPRMIVEGWAGACFGFELCLRLPERRDDVLAWIDAAQKPDQAVPRV